MTIGVGSSQGWAQNPATRDLYNERGSKQTASKAFCISTR
jgi:hypothetical protein